MRRFVLCMALAIASVRPLGAQTMLYTTLASKARVDGYSVFDDGSLSPDPVTTKPTAGPHPRRIIARGCNVYVTEKDRVEVFRIHDRGGLELIGATRASTEIRAHDIDLWPKGTEGNASTLVVPLRRQGALAAFPLDDQGVPNYAPVQQGSILAGQPLSCVFGPPGADWEDIEVQNDKVYAAYTDRVEVYGIVKDKVCTNNIAETCTVDADCRRCETGHGDNQLRCSNNIAILCTTSADCVGTCEAGLADKLACSNDPATSCRANSDCAPVCASGQLIGALAEDTNQNGTVDPDEKNCSQYSPLPVTSTVSCLDTTVRPKSARPARPDANCPFSFRGHLSGAVGLVVDGPTLVMSMRFTHKMQGFVLEPDTGNFPPVTNPADDDKTNKKAKKKERSCRKRNRTDETIRYIGLTLNKPATPTDPLLIYGAGYSGRTDQFQFKPSPDDKPDCDKYVPPGALVLPKQLTSTTPKNVVSTPVRTALGATAQGRPILYVAGGELNRIQAFRLFDGGQINADDSPMQTNEQDDSFPNDVVLVDITSCD